MLRVHPVNDKAEQEKFCSLCNISYDADMLCYAAYEDDDFLGISLFRIIGKTGIIYNILLRQGADDREALYLLGKATLNFIDLCGIKNAEYRGDNKDLSLQLEFLEKDGVYTLNLEGYFESPCQRHKKA